MSASPTNLRPSFDRGPQPAAWVDVDEFMPLLVGLLVAIGLHAAVILTFMAPTLAQWVAHPFSHTTQPEAEKPPPPLATVPPPQAKAPPSSPREPAAMPRPQASPATPRLARSVKKITLPKEKDNIRFGRDNGDPTSIAWIGYDDYRELMARKGITEQPALQKDVEPLPGAPIRPDPTPPHGAIAAHSGGGAVRPPLPEVVAVPSPPTAAPPVLDSGSLKPVPYSPAKTATASPPSQSVQPGPLVKPVEPQPAPAPSEQQLAIAGQKLPIVVPPSHSADGIPVGDLVKPVPPPTPVETVKPTAPSGEPLVAKPRVLSTVTGPVATQPAQPEIVPMIAASGTPGKPGNPSKSPAPRSDGPSVALPAEAARPTGAPKSNSESTPVSLTGSKTIPIRPGRVLAGEGIEIQTAVPRFSVAVRFTSPRNPVVRVVFSKQGDVIDAEILKSSEYPNVDGPILASLYRWHASGKKLAELNRSFEVTIAVILVDE